MATFAGERSSPLLANALLFDTVPKAAFAKSPPCLKGGGGGDSVSLPRQHCAKGRLHLIHPLRAPPPLRGTSPERGRFIYGSIRESTLPQLFIIHQRSGFIIQYSFVPTHHPGCPFRQYRAKGDVFRTPREGRPYVLFIHSSRVPPPPRWGTSPERGRFFVVPVKIRWSKTEKNQASWLAKRD